MKYDANITYVIFHVFATLLRDRMSALLGMEQYQMIQVCAISWFLEQSTKKTYGNTNGSWDLWADRGSSSFAPLYLWSLETSFLGLMCRFLKNLRFFPRYFWRIFFLQLLELRYVETESYGCCCRCSCWWPHPSSCILIMLRHPAEDRTGSQFESVWSQVISAKTTGTYPPWN